MESLRFDAIGVPWQIDSPAPLSPALVDRIRARIEVFDRTWSRFRDDSLVARIRETPGRYEFPPDAAKLLSLYRKLYDATDGAMSPLVGRALESQGYDRGYSLRPTAAAAAPSWDDSVAWDGEALSTVTPVVVDVGAAGKGYLVDIVGNLLHEAGVDEFTIDASGDLLRAGGDSIRVGLEHPLDASKAIGIANLGDASLCASASNRRAWRGTHHILDATTGLPTRTVIATWVIAPGALVADGLATALFFVPAERLAPVADFEYVRMTSDGRVEHSAGFDGELFA